MIYVSSTSRSHNISVIFRVGLIFIEFETSLESTKIDKDKKINEICYTILRVRIYSPRLKGQIETGAQFFLCTVLSSPCI